MLIFSVMLQHLHSRIDPDKERMSMNVQVITPPGTTSCQHEAATALHLQKVVEAMRSGETIITIPDNMFEEVSKLLLEKFGMKIDISPVQEIAERFTAQGPSAFAQELANTLGTSVKEIKDTGEVKGHEPESTTPEEQTKIPSKKHLH